LLTVTRKNVAFTDVLKGSALGAKTATIFSRELLSIKDADSMDGEEKKIALQLAWDKFLSSNFVALRSALVEFSSRGALPKLP
jgi:hypothetical protein